MSSRFIGAAVVSLLVGTMFGPAVASPLEALSAQPFGVAAQGAAGQVPGAANLFESTRDKLCAESSCIINFPVIPAGSVLQATHLNCLGVINGEDLDQLGAFRLFERKPGDVEKAIQRVVLLTDNAIEDGGTVSAFGVNEEIRVFIPAGKIATVLLTTNTAVDSINLSCTLSGSLL